jgi:hypothetical protein
MKHHAFLLMICGLLLTLAACTLQPSLVPVPTPLPTPPTARQPAGMDNPHFPWHLCQSLESCPEMKE